VLLLTLLLIGGGLALAALMLGAGRTADIGTQPGHENEPDCLADDEANYDPASDTEPYGY